MKETRKQDKVRVFPVVEDNVLYLQTQDGKDVANFDRDVNKRHIFNFCDQHGYQLVPRSVR